MFISKFLNSGYTLFFGIFFLPTVRNNPALHASPFEDNPWEEVESTHNSIDLSN